MSARGKPRRRRGRSGHLVYYPPPGREPATAPEAPHRPDALWGWTLAEIHAIARTAALANKWLVSDFIIRYEAAWDAIVDELLAAGARPEAHDLAMYRAGRTGCIADELPPARHEVAAGLIHGVDINPLAVDISRLVVAATAYIPGVPNPPLDHHVKCGNALLGVTPALLAKGIPDAAHEALPGDDPKIAAELRRRNRAERQAWLDGLPAGAA